MGRKRFNKFGDFGKVEDKSKRFTLDPPKTKKHLSEGQKKQYGDRKNQALTKIEDIRKYVPKSHTQSLEWLNKIGESLDKQVTISKKQMKVLINLQNQYVPTNSKIEKIMAPYREDIKKLGNKNHQDTLINDFELHCYTDGSYDAVKGIGGLAFVVVKDENEIIRFSHSSERETSNRMEYMALIEAVNWLEKNVSEFKAVNILIQSDSDLLVKTYNEWMISWKKNGWTKRDKKSGEIKNLDLVKTIFEIRVRYPNICLKWIKSHNGNKWNRLVDKLARSAYLDP